VATSVGTAVEGHGGELALAGLAGYGIEEIFTLSGGHIFPVYDACQKAGWRIVDVRHEQTATFAAEGMARLTRRPAVAVLTAGPGVTNGVSAITTAWFNGTPVVMVGGRAPRGRWGAGSLQELDHVPIVRPVTKEAVTVESPDAIGPVLNRLARAAMTPHRGPVFVDVPMDVLFSSGSAELPQARRPVGSAADPEEVERAGRMLAGADRPALVAGGDVWWEGAWEPLRRLVETLRVPTFVNGAGRGCLPADHELAFARTRSMLVEADVVAVVGTPLDFRLSFGRFGSAEVVHVVDSPDRRAGHADVACSPAGNIASTLEGMAAVGRGQVDHESWIERVRAEELSRRAAEAAELESDARPVHPARVYGELRRRLDRDAVVIGDGGDFVSYAGRLLESYEPGCWLDPGPYGCLGTGLGYAVAARLAHPDRQVVLMAGDGAFGFCGMDVDTLVRHRLPVVIVIGNNGIWGLEKHPMQAVYGYDVAADLQPECRYDQVVRALGGAGELVSEPSDLGPALDRAFASGVPYLVNVLTDPAVAYPRSSNLG
jgi:thiamine pyrophosphate-dependent acetolactate synthase large subunit-like protein